MIYETRWLEPQAQICSQKGKIWFEALARNLPVALLLLDNDLKIKWANKAFGEILGHSVEEIQLFSKGLVSILSPEERQGHSSWLKDVIAGRKPLNSQKRFKIFNKNGSVTYCLCKPYFISFQENAPLKKLLHLMIIDETDRVLLKKCAGKDERLRNLGAMSAEMAHEIKNAITAIGGLAKRLRKAMPESTEARIIESESARLEKLVKSVNAYVRPGLALNSRQPVGQILDQGLQLMAPELKSRAIHVDLRLQDLPQNCKADSDALLEVFVNLIKNAIDALENGGCLTLTSRASKDFLYLQFENKMEKKSVADPKKLFQSMEEGGSSIGLPLSFKIMKNLGGSLSFNKKDGSAVFTVKLLRI